MTIKDEFDVVLEHGTNVKVRFEIETENFDTADTGNLLSKFIQLSRKFYFRNLAPFTRKKNGWC